MQLLECLTRCAADQLERIARTCGEWEAERRGALEERVAACLTDRARLQGVLADLSDEEWAALKVVYFNGGEQGITVELCHQIVNLLSGKRRKQAATALAGLQDRGLVFLRTQNYRQVFFLPGDLMEVLGDILNRQIVRRVCVTAEETVRPVLPEHDLMEDLHRFLAHLYQHEVTLTQQGQIFKRHLRALLELLGSNAEEESLVGRYPEPLGFLVGYAMDRHLVQRAEGRLEVTEDLQPWIDQPSGAKQADLFAYWQDRYFYQDLQTFLSVMRSVEGHWVSLQRLVAEVEPLINPSQRGSFLLRLKHHLSTFLAPLGMVELAQTGSPEESDLACRLAPAGEAVLKGELPPEAEGTPQGSLLLQATFEALLPRPAPARSLWMLELMGDLVRRTDRTLTYRLSRQSIYRALKKGIRGEEMLDFLQAHSATGVPQNVAFDLRAWAEAYGQVYLQAVTLLRCANPILAQQIKASRRTARFVIGELTPSDLMVDAAHVRELMEALEADGLMPRPEISQV